MPKDALTRRRGRKPAWVCQEQTPHDGPDSTGQLISKNSRYRGMKSRSL